VLPPNLAGSDEWQRIITDFTRETEVGKFSLHALLIIPPYGSLGVFSLLCVILFVILFVCTVTDFSATEKDRGVKFCMRVGLLSRQVFSPFGELWLAGSHGGGILCGSRN